jgi:hypothetical protein
VNPRAGLGDVVEIKSMTLRDSNADPSVVQPIANHHIYYATRTVASETQVLYLKIMKFLYPH